MKPWELLSSEYVLDTFWVRVRKDAVRLAQGVELDDFYVIERRDFAVICGLTPDQQVVLVRQYKHGTRAFMTELPAGFIEDGEAPEAAAQREFEEETGFRADTYIPLGALHVGPSSMKHTAHAFLALDAVDTGRQHLDETEDIEVSLMPLAELRAAVTDGRISCMSSVAAALLALEKLKNGPPPS